LGSLRKAGTVVWVDPGQARVDEARTRLADFEAAEEEDDSMTLSFYNDKENSFFGFESRDQLEQDLADMAAQIKSAIDSKDFSKAWLLVGIF
jgi:hypothetical protein